MTEYEMTEYEINKAVLHKLGYHLIEDYYAENKCFFDPCNNAQQAWEIMLANNISITRYENIYEAVLNLSFIGCGEWNVDKVVSNEKPFVAAMLLFLEI